MALILCSLVFFSPLSAPTPEAQIHAMARESSASASEQWGADELPLILCTDCGLRQVVRRRSKKEWSLGKVFYCCPLHKVSSGVSWCVDLLPAHLWFNWGRFELVLLVCVAWWKWMPFLVLGRRLRFEAKEPWVAERRQLNAAGRPYRRPKDGVSAC